MDVERQAACLFARRRLCGEGADVFARDAFARMVTQDGIVVAISVQTSATMADFRIAFGVPDESYSILWQARDSLTKKYYYYEAHTVYRDHPLELTLSTMCPLTLNEMWQTPLVIGLPASPVYSSAFTPEERAFAPLPKECQ